MSNHNPPTNGFDKRKHQINRKGRPRTFDAFRELAQQIAHETAQSGGQDLVINGRKATVAEMILRSWAKSQNAQLQRAFIEIAFGKVPDNLDITTGGEPLINYDERVKRALAIIETARNRDDS